MRYVVFVNKGLLVYGGYVDAEEITNSNTHFLQ
jgi:hypothetical protein